MKTLRNKILAVLAVILIAGAAYTMGGGVTFGPQSASAAPVLYSEDAVTAIYNTVSPAVVEIQTTQQGTGFYGRSFQQGEGSGFLVDNQGHILTNNHVVSGATTVQVVLDGGKTIDAKVVGTDPIDDLALISVDPAAVSGITPLQFADSGAVKPGQMAIAVGNPYGLVDSITIGIISGINRSLSGSSLTGMLQTDAAINPGNSGGPLLDAQGNVIGINTAIESATGARGIGFAVPSNTATKVLPSLMAGTQVTRPWLGISGTALTQAQAQDLGLSVNEGVYVVTVVAGSPAEKAGLKGAGTDASGALAAGGDVITAADSTVVTSVEALSAYLNTKQVGDNVNLTVLRNGQNLSVQVTLGTWPDNLQTGTPNTPQQPQPRMPRPWGGQSEDSED